MVWLKVLLLLSLQLYFLHQVSACRCLVHHIHSQNAFCDNNVDFVIKAKIKKVVSRGTKIMFKLKKREIFKSSPAFDSLPNKAKKKVFTLVGSSACEAQMSRNNTYVFTGKVGSGKLWVSSCDYIRLWSSLEPVEKHNFQSNYIENCGCSFDQVGGVAPPFPFPPTTCILIWTHTVPCGKYVWCQCANDPCTSCSLVKLEPDYSNCTFRIPLPP